MQLRHRDQNEKFFSSFVAKILKVNKIAMKSFLNLPFEIDFKLKFPLLMKKIKPQNKGWCKKLGCNPI